MSVRCNFSMGIVAPYKPDLPCVKTTAFSLSSTQFKALEYFHLMSRKWVSTCSAPMGTSAATDFLVAQGIDTISKRVLMRTDRLCRGLEQRGYSILSSREDGHKPRIVPFKHSTLPSFELYNLLLANRIQGTERAEYIRLSPHFYNSEEEIDEVLALLSVG